MALITRGTSYTRDFLMVLASDHLTGATGKTPAVTISKAGGAFSAMAGTVAEIGNGVYRANFTAADTSTLGDLEAHATATGCDPTDWTDQITALNLNPTGGGSATHTHTEYAQDGTTPIQGVKVLVSTDALGANVVAVGTTDTFGVVTFLLDAGPYYLWRSKAGRAFTNPLAVTVS